MKTYRHTATVKAARILSITDGRNIAPFLPDLEGDEEEEMSYRAWSAAARDVLAGNPLGYLVIHPNGIDGYVPKSEFEAGFSPAALPTPEDPTDG